MDVSRQPGFSQDPLPPIAGGGQSGKHESRVALAGTPRGDDSELTPLNKNQGKGAGHQVGICCSFSRIEHAISSAVWLHLGWRAASPCSCVLTVHMDDNLYSTSEVMRH